MGEEDFTKKREDIFRSINLLGTHSSACFHSVKNRNE